MMDAEPLPSPGSSTRHALNYTRPLRGQHCPHHCASVVAPCVRASDLCCHSEQIQSSRACGGSVGSGWGRCG